MRRHAHLLEASAKGVPGAADVARFAAGALPQSVTEALRHHRLDQICPHVAPGHVDTLLQHKVALEADASPGAP